MELTVDPTIWEVSRNRAPPRPQSKNKTEEIKKQVDKLLELGVIGTSTASEHSQVHLVPKPTPGEWRFCIDFVNLNAATTGQEGWPLPNVSQMLQRIGEKRAKFYGVMDLTAGYHQLPLATASMLFTAFITFMGLYHWFRLAMGLRGAAPYFQRTLATIVLAGLMYAICELYIDDVLTFGRTAEEFIANLRMLFTRFRMYNITLNPKKCNFGLSQVEYVGHVIDENGVTFSVEKREKVLHFPLPRRMVEMLSFLGLVNYFRDHLPDISELTRPLREMTTPYKKNNPLTYTPEQEKLFYHVCDVVANCAKLEWIDDKSPIIVYTDASDYGAGGWVVQVRDGIEHPILFWSQAFSGAQLNWSTIEKECFAIFRMLTKHEYLLSDVPFRLKTDHKNLAINYLNTGGSQKVKRWKMAIQPFNFFTDWIDGESNIVADKLSRLCVLWDTEEMYGKFRSAGFEEGTPECLYATKLLTRQQVELLTADIHTKISNYHNAVVGHSGVDRTLAKMVKGGEKWRGMKKQIRSFVRMCPCCQKMSFLRTPIHTHPFTVAAYNPMEVISIDTAGPLPEDSYGNKYILAVIDNFSRWLELYPTKDTTARAAAVAMVGWVGRYGIPDEIHSDRGSQFVNELFLHLQEILGCKHTFSTAYSKEENSIAERSIGTTMKQLEALLFDKRVHDKWSMEQLPLVMRIHNSEVHSSIGVSPAEILFGNSVNLNRSLIPIPDEIRTPESLSTWVAEMLEAQRVLIDVAQKTQSQKDDEHMETDDGLIPVSEYPIGSYVLLTHPKGRRSKLHTNKLGPFQVVNSVGSTYTLQDLILGKNSDYHVSCLTPFLYDPNFVQPKEIAIQDNQEFLVQSVLEFRGDKNRRAGLEFKIR